MTDYLKEIKKIKVTDVRIEIKVTAIVKGGANHTRQSTAVQPPTHVLKAG